MRTTVLPGRPLLSHTARAPEARLLLPGVRSKLDLQFHLVLRLEKAQEGRRIESEVGHQNARGGVTGQRLSAERDCAREEDRLGNAMDLEASGNPDRDRAAIHIGAWESIDRGRGEHRGRISR